MRRPDAFDQLTSPGVHARTPSNTTNRWGVADSLGGRGGPGGGGGGSGDSGDGDGEGEGDGEPPELELPAALTARLEAAARSFATDFALLRSILVDEADRLPALHTLNFRLDFSSFYAAAAAR